MLEKKELKELLHDLVNQAKSASEGYLYLLNDGKIYFDRNSNIEFRDDKKIIASRMTPLKNSTGPAEERWINQIIWDYFREENSEIRLAYRKWGDNFAPTIFIYAADVKLPYAFTIAEEARVGVTVNPYYDYIESETIIVSDPKWADSTKVYGFDCGSALKFAGGKEKVQQMIENLLQEWKEYHRD